MQADLDALLQRLRATEAMAAKLAIQQPARFASLPGGSTADQRYALPGDDTAAIRCGEQYQLLAIEGMLPAFVEQAPWFAGWSAVMANVSDITAMGGRATAVVNAYWHHQDEPAEQLLAGIRAACDAYGLLLAGGHTSLAAGNPAALAVAIIGWARSLLSTWHVQPGQMLATAVDLDGQWHGNAAYWKAFEHCPPERLRAKLEVIPRLAEAGLLRAAKDISNAGLLGTLLMLLETTGCGASIRLDELPRPADGDLERWLQAFPSYGFVFTLAPEDFPVVQAAFAYEGLQCSALGEVSASARLDVQLGSAHATFWDLAAAPFTGMTPTAHPHSSREH
ncbi:sll0787 family AIR synthase-like protein [Pseudomonas sp. HR96]|uniref:sll0787 family AIR synthase-like protein n=1 Tax=Pseudomonas sp. HR96 TaxID=1027966 RepID=UPI002A747362|nr:sll0787 family AIR synthase-like protein [Pseudomonas sp. HR96]WPO98349.1 sll0787 family AIR synthase-like protein [Pseudomonas sp. HR96]